MDEFGFVLILLSVLIALRPKCDSNGENLVVLCLHMRSWYIIDFNAALMVNKFNSLFASFIHAKRCFIVLISLSTKPIAQWLFAGAGNKVLFFVQKFFT